MTVETVQAILGSNPYINLFIFNNTIHRGLRKPFGKSFEMRNELSKELNAPKKTRQE